MMRTATMGAGTWLLGCVIVGATWCAPGVAAEGPFVALDKARGVAAQAERRAVAMDAQAGVEHPAAAPAAAPQAAPAETGTGAAGAGGTAGGEAAGASEGHAQATAGYDPSQHRNPFQPPTIAADNTDEGPRTPLERYEIGQLKLVGVVWGEEASRAMVEDSAGLGYIVVRGTPIGSSGGFVRDIEPTRVLIEESATNFYGEAEPREVVMELPKEDGSP